MVRSYLGRAAIVTCAALVKDSLFRYLDVGRPTVAPRTAVCYKGQDNARTTWTEPAEDNVDGYCSGLAIPLREKCVCVESESSFLRLG